MVEAVTVGVTVFTLIIGVYYYLGFRSEKRSWKKKVTTWYSSGEERKSFIVLLGDKYDRSERAKPMFEKLRQANIPFTPSEFIGATIVLTFGVMVLLQNFFSVKFPLSLFFAYGIVELAKRLFFLLNKNKLKRKIAEQLPEVCKTLANATRSGMTLNQGIHLVAQEINEPAKTEFKRLAHELSLGVDFNRALKNMETRLESREFQLFVATLLIQKKAGGNLFAVLDEMSQTLEDRKLLLQEIKTMTAEQRYISYMVPVIPIFLVLMMNNVIDGFLDPLFSTVGMILFGLFMVGVILTFILVRKVTNFKV